MPRIGEILSHSVPLSDHDLEEILQEQKATRQRFGEAALSLGKAKPQQVWDAWLAQVRDGQIDPQRVSADAAAVALLPTDLARAFSLVPLRVRGSVLVVACAESLSDGAVRQIEQRCGVQLVVALATRAAIDRVMAMTYPAAAPAA